MILQCYTSHHVYTFHRQPALNCFFCYTFKNINTCSYACNIAPTDHFFRFYSSKVEKVKERVERWKRAKGKKKYFVYKHYYSCLKICLTPTLLSDCKDKLTLPGRPSKVIFSTNLAYLVRNLSLNHCTFWDW